MSDTVRSDDGRTRVQGRRAFLKMLGIGAGAGLMAGGVAACDFLPNPNPGTNPQAVTLDFSNDFGVLNYAYALEQLEAAFYTFVVGGLYGGASAMETKILTDVRDHEIAHRDYFKRAITALGGTPLPTLTFDFSSVSFGSRTSVLQTARTFEDLGVSAYNGAGSLLNNAALLLVAGKIVSVEARHAAAIRDLLQPNTAYYAGDDVVDANGLDRALMPPAVLAAADPFIQNEIRVVGL